MDAVVKVFCVHTRRSFSRPWEESEYVSESSGFIIEGRRVLTSSHSVENYRQVRLKKRGSEEIYVATVLAFGSDCGIALLTVDNDEFWDGVSPVEFGALPAVQDTVTVVGYPLGQHAISITGGVVSCVDMFSYIDGSTELLALQINPGINSGHSGGPAFNHKGQFVGISFQSLKDGDSENIGYLVSTPVVKHFFKDYEKLEKYTGFPVLGIEWQNLVNRCLREAMGVASGQTGIRIRQVDPIASASQYLKVDDVIIRFDGVGIANDGTVPFRDGGRISFSYLVSQKYNGDTVVIEVLRDSKAHKFNVELRTNTRLIPRHIQRKPISYYIVGGLVFTAVSKHGKDYDELLDSSSNSPDDQIVVISQVLVAAEISNGYEDFTNLRVLTFNGKPVKNLRSLANMIDKCNKKYLRFILDKKIVVLETKTAKAATLDILAMYRIPSPIGFI